jgi:hypothetical protein
MLRLASQFEQNTHYFLFYAVTVGALRQLIEFGFYDPIFQRERRFAVLLLHKLPIRPKIKS